MCFAVIGFNLVLLSSVCHVNVESDVATGSDYSRTFSKPLLIQLLTQMRSHSQKMNPIYLNKILM